MFLKIKEEIERCVRVCVCAGEGEDGYTNIEKRTAFSIKLMSQSTYSIKITEHLTEK